MRFCDPLLSVNNSVRGPLSQLDRVVVELEAHDDDESLIIASLVP